MDYLKFDYEDKLAEAYTSQRESKVVFAPKFNIIYAASAGMQFYAKSGIGFHSNDTRVVIQNNSKEILPRAFGLDVGLIVKPTDRMAINIALWSLFLEQEFVYVGDAGIIEPSGKTTRRGIDLGIRYQLADWLYVNGDLNYTYARSSGEPEGENYIPLAPDLTSSGGLTFNNLGHFSGGLQYRFIGDRPANEDNSIVAEGYFVSDFNLNYNYGNWNFGIIAENIFNTKWNETSPVEEIHFTPGSPFFLRGKVTVHF
jgi:outer membrane receptor protein involved in Fe transport